MRRLSRAGGVVEFGNWVAETWSEAEAGSGRRVFVQRGGRKKKEWDPGNVEEKETQSKEWRSEVDEYIKVGWSDADEEVDRKVQFMSVEFTTKYNLGLMAWIATNFFNVSDAQASSNF